MKLDSTVNEWGGLDARGSEGVARFTREELGPTTVYRFTPSMVVLWSVTIGHGAPDDLFARAWEKACEETRGAPAPASR